MRTASAAFLCLIIVGCHPEGIPGTTSAAKAKAGKAKTAPTKPRNAKAFYARMSEIDGRMRTLMRAEQRHLRRQVEDAGPEGGRKAMRGTLERLLVIVGETESRLEALGEGPEATRPLLTLRMRQARRARTLLEGLLAAEAKGDDPKFRRLEALSNTESAEIERQMKAVEAKLRTRLNLNAATEADAPTSKPMPGQKARLTRLPKGTAAKDRVFVVYLRSLARLIKAQNRETERGIADTAARMPRDPAKRDSYFRAELIRWRARDRASLSALRRLGPPPAPLAAFVRANLVAVQESADEFTRILATERDAEGMRLRLQSPAYAAAADERAREVRSGFATARAHLDRIKARGTVPASLWAKLEE